MFCNMDLPDRLNTCIIIVTYNPNISFVTNLKRHLEIVDKVVIVDNNSEFAIESLINNLDCKNVDIIHSHLNNGIAWALNRGIKYITGSQYKWILTFDQDSYPNLNILSYYSEVLRAENNVGLIGTLFATENLLINRITWKNKLTIITSGTLHPISIFDKVNYYNEKLFIDGVDFDFSLRVKLAGYKVIRIQSPLIKHQIGSPIRKFGLTSSNHNSIRRYYFARNNIYLTKTYFKSFPIWVLKKNCFFIKSIIIMIIVEKSIIKKIVSIIKGAKDGIKNL